MQKTSIKGRSVSSTQRSKLLRFIQYKFLFYDSKWFSLQCMMTSSERSLRMKLDSSEERSRGAKGVSISERPTTAPTTSTTTTTTTTMATTAFESSQLLT